jgi:YVTN family beta-propeller protein
MAIYAYVPNAGNGTANGTVSVIDISTMSVLATITVGKLPQGATVSPDGNRVYVCNTDDGTVSVIDTATNTVIATITVGTAPLMAAASPDGSKVYVANSGTNTVSVIGTATNTVLATISLGTSSGPLAIAVTPDGTQVYTANNGTADVSVIDATTNTVKATVSIGLHPEAVATTPDSKYAYVSATGAGEIYVIDTSTNTVSTTITHGGITNLAISPDGSTGYLVDSGAGIIRLDIATNTILSGVVGITGAAGISFTPDGSQAYVTDTEHDTVSIIETATFTLNATVINVGSFPYAFGQFIQPASIPMSNIPYAAPQGRLTLTSGSPVMTSDVTGATDIYYDPYQGNIVPIYDGANMQSYTFGELTMALDTTNQVSGKIYDLFAYLSSGVPAIGAGPAWTNSTTRSAAIEQISGLWVNTASITLTNGSGSGNSVAAGKATYLGSVYMTANGQTGVQFKPAGAAGGTNNIVGIWNAYNRVRVQSMCSDSNTSWTYATATWRPLDGASGNVNNRVTYLDGLGQSFARARVNTIAYNNTAGNGCAIGVVQNSTTNAPSKAAAFQGSAGGNAAGACDFVAEENFPPVLGLNYIQGMENSPNATTVTFAFNGNTTDLLYDGEY